MSAVRKEETIIPIRPADPDEPRFTPISEMFVAPFWGKYEHSEEDLREMWSRIWKCFKSRRLCEGFLSHHKSYPLETWAAAFEEVRQRKDGEFEHIRYVKKIAEAYLLNETPAQLAEREAREVEAKLAAKLEQRRILAERSGETAPNDPDVQAFERRSKPAPIEDTAQHPMTLRIKNRNRG